MITTNTEQNSRVGMASIHTCRVVRDRPYTRTYNVEITLIEPKRCLDTKYKRKRLTDVRNVRHTSCKSNTNRSKAFPCFVFGRFAD